MLQDGQEIAGYRLLRKIGEGGMGQVFLAEQLRLRRQVAIKLVYLDVKADMLPGSAEPMEELTREAEALMALEHPHILPLYDAGREGDTAYLVMPYLPEGSLQEALRPGQRQQLQLPLPPGEALIYLEQAAAALQYAHDRNFIHRDVKPANFLVRSLSRSTSRSASSERAGKRLHLFLADFGLSKFLAYSTNTTHLSGTPAYMAPEQFQGRANHASDQYSLAVLFYYLLAGDLPYRGSPVELMFHHLNDPPPSPSALVGGLPEPLAKVVQRGMAKRPEDRYPSVASMAEAAREALVAAGLAPSQDSFPAIAAVRAADLQPEKLAGDKQDSLLAATSVGELPAPATIAADGLATARGPVGIGARAAPAKAGESSLPTLPMEGPHVPSRLPRSDELPSERRPHRYGRIIALVALAVIIATGAVFGGALLQLSPFQTATPVAQFTKVPTSGPISTSTLGPTPITQTTPTPAPASSLLNSILAKRPIYQVNLDAGSGQWDSKAIDPNASNHIYTPSGLLDILDTRATFNAQEFSAPLAVAVALQAGGDQEFDIILDTTDGSSHQIYRLKLTNDAPPQVAHSSDNHTFTVDGTGTSVNTAWADGGTHTLVLVLDGTRLLFYVDNQPLLDAHVPQPDSSAGLTLATVGEAMITGIKIYDVSQVG